MHKNHKKNLLLSYGWQLPSSFNLLAPKQIKTWGPGQFGGSVQLGNAVVISDGFAIFIPKGIIGEKIK